MKIPKSILAMLPHVERVNIKDIDALDNAVDYMVESASQKSARLQAQLKQDKLKGDIDNASGRKTESQ